MIPALLFSPKSQIGKAITYMLVINGEKLKLYVDNGSYLIIGRKNYMFAGSQSATQNAAVIYTMIAMCKLDYVDPYAWQCDILNRVAGTKPCEYNVLLPINWKSSQD